MHSHRSLAATSASPAPVAATTPTQSGAVAARETAQGPADNAVKPEPERFYLQEYRVEGARKLSRIEVEKAVYPFLGPGRTENDVEQARAALEKAYQANGYQTVSVQVPSQQVKGGIVVLQVVETTVGRLRVRGSRYFSLHQVKRLAPSLAEGKVINFNEVNRDIVGMQLPDRQVTPALHAGVEPGTVDVDLNVKDKFPLHGSLELNNRYSANTAPLRLNGSVSYTNLWQLGHSAGLSFQMSPEDMNQVQVYSGYYIAPVPTVSWLSLMLQGTKQDSDVSTLGGANSTGLGETIGIRALVTLPPGQGFYHSFRFGLDYKHYNQGLTTSGTTDRTPISYYPFTLGYTASWIGKNSDTELNSDLIFHFRGMGSTTTSFDTSRYNADGNFVYLRGDLTHTHELPAGMQIFGKVQGQLSNQPLVNSEQFSAGGLGTVRGYLESEVLGDNAVVGTVELRTPSLSKWMNAAKLVNEWRAYVFLDAGMVTVRNALPEQTSEFDLASFGVGSRLQLFGHLNGSIDAGFPMISQGETHLHDVHLTFRAWAEF